MAAKIRFFKKAHFFWITAITMGMTLLAMCHYVPDSVPHDEIPPLGYLTGMLCAEYPTLLAVVWYMAVGAHIGEALYAYNIAYKCVRSFFTF